MAYTDAPEVAEIANKMIDEYPEFEHLQEKPIAYNFTDKNLIDNVIGKCVKASAVWKPDGVADFKIIIHGPSWEVMTENQRLALVHHELMHADYSYHEKKNIYIPTLRKHDVQEFIQTKERFGDWDSTREAYANAGQTTKVG